MLLISQFETILVRLRSFLSTSARYCIKLICVPFCTPDSS